MKKMSEVQPKVIVIAGPTGSGKSDLALTLAQEFKAELICTDSMQVYRRMNIGTAKPTLEEQELVPHHQLDLIEPDGHYSAGQFERDTKKIIDEVDKRGRIPILVGGSGLYYRALMYGISDIPDIPDEIRQEVMHWQSSNGNAFCWEKLQQLDKEAALRLHVNDTARVLRALEVVVATGNTLSKYQQQRPFSEARYPFKMIVLNWDRDCLYQRINQRTQMMLDAGWIAEVEMILKDFSSELKALQSIGYREIMEYIQGNILENDLVPKIQQRTRRYAKRQITWFRKEKNVAWFKPGEDESMKIEVKQFLEN